MSRAERALRAAALGLALALATGCQAGGCGTGEGSADAARAAAPDAAPLPPVRLTPGPAPASTGSGPAGAAPSAEVATAPANGPPATPGPADCPAAHPADETGHCAVPLRALRAPGVAHAGMPVAVTGVVTAVRYDRGGVVRALALQSVEPEAPVEPGKHGARRPAAERPITEAPVGLWAYGGAHLGTTLQLAAGARVTVRGALAAAGPLRLDSTNSVSFAGGQPSPPLSPRPLPLTAASHTSPGVDALDGVLVQLPAATVSGVHDDPQAEGVSARRYALGADGPEIGGALLALSPTLVEGSTLAGLVGVVRRDRGRTVIEPRTEADVARGAARLAHFGPTRVRLHAEEEGPALGLDGRALTLALDRYVPPGAQVRVTLESDDPRVVVPASVTISDGNYEATPTLLGKGTATDVTVRARLGDVVFSVLVDVLPRRDRPRVLLLDLPPAVLAGRAFTALPRIDRPAPPEGLSVVLQVEPFEAAWGADSAFIPGGAFVAEAPFVLRTAPQAEPTSLTLTATTDRLSAAAKTRLVVGWTGPAPLINAVARTAGGLRVELLNPLPHDVPLGGLTLEIHRSDDVGPAATLDLTAIGAPLRAGGRLVILADGAPEPAGAGPDPRPVAARLPAVEWPLGTALGVCLFERPGRAPIDAVSFGGRVEGCGEGDAAPAPTENDAIGRCPDGRDHDDNARDFQPIPAPLGAANACAERAGDLRP